MSVSRTQLRFQQITGSIPSDVLSKVANKDSIAITSVSGTIDHLASAIKRLHGFTAFTGNDPGSFNTNVYISGSLIDLNQAATVQTAAGDLTIKSAAASVNIQGVEAAANAIYLNASNAAGGVDVDAGTGGVAIDTTGVFSINGADDSDITVSTAAKDLALTVSGGGAQVLQLNSAGTGADAIDVNATAGGIDVDAAGAIAIDSSAGTITVGGNDIDQNINVGTDGVRAIGIGTISGTGGVPSTSVTAAAVVIDIDGGATGVTIDALDAGTIGIGTSANAASDTSAINIGTSATARTITVGNAASTKVDVNALIIELDSAGTFILDAVSTATMGATAFDIDADGGAGSGTVAIDTNDTTNGVTIGTANANVPISIGNAISEVTVNDNLTVTGDLTVNGATTTVDTTNLLVEDPVVALAMNAGSQNQNGGIAILSGSTDSDLVLGRVANDTWGVGKKATLKAEVVTLADMTLVNMRASRFEVDTASDYIDVSTDLTLVAAADILLDPAGAEVKADASIIPNSDNARDLGMEDNGVSRRWRDGYFSRNLFVSGALASRGSTLHITASTSAGAQITFGDGYSGVEGMGGGNNGRIKLAGSGEYTEFISAFTNTTTIIGAINSLAAGVSVKFSGSVGNVNIIPQGSDPGTAPVVRNTQVHVKDMTLDQVDLGKVSDSNTHVYLNGSMLMSGSAALVTAGVHADYVVIGSGSIKFGFQLEQDDVISVIKS